MGFPSLPVRLTEVNTNAIMENTATHASGGAAPVLLLHFKRLRLPSGSVISNFFPFVCTDGTKEANADEQMSLGSDDVQI